MATAQSAPMIKAMVPCIQTIELMVSGSCVSTIAWAWITMMKKEKNWRAAIIGRNHWRYRRSGFLSAAAAVPANMASVTRARMLC